MAISSANKLEIYNAALLFITERRLAALTDSVEPRRLLDDVWDAGGVNKVLEHGQWNFAMRASAIMYDPDITPAFGHVYAFKKPTDFIRICALCEDQYFNSPLLSYNDEPNYWYASIDTIYVKYVSNDGSYGTDYSIWPNGFKEYVNAWFGCQIIGKLTQSDITKEEAKKKELRKLLLQAKSTDAMNDPTTFMPIGNFRKARYGGTSMSRYSE